MSNQLVKRVTSTFLKILISLSVRHDPRVVLLQERLRHSGEDAVPGVITVDQSDKPDALRNLIQGAGRGR